MNSNEQAAVRIEAEIRERHQVFRGQLTSFSNVFGSEASSDTKRRALLELLGHATDFFNLCEQSVGDTSLLGAHRNEAWVQNKAETSLNVLSTILDAHQTFAAVGPVLGLPAEALAPSETAYASLQRLVSMFFPERVDDLRSKFVATGVPTTGFASDTDDPSPSLARREVDALRKEWVPFGQDLDRAVASNPMGFLSLPKVGAQLAELEAEGSRLVALHAPWLADQWSACGYKRRPTSGTFERRGLMDNEVPLTVVAEEVRERLVLLELVAKEISRADEHAKSSSADYFHVLVQPVGSMKPAMSLDLTQEQLMSEIVGPRLAGKIIRVDGHSVGADMPVIKITRTERAAAAFAREHDATMRKRGIADLGTDRRRLPLELGEDVTNRFLGSLNPKPVASPAISPEGHVAKVHQTIVWVFGAITLAAIAAAIVSFALNSSGNTSLELFGQDLRTTSVGVACIGIAVIALLLTVRAVLKNIENLAALKAGVPTKAPKKPKP